MSGTNLNIDPKYTSNFNKGMRSKLTAGLAALFLFLGGLGLWNYQLSKAYFYSAMREVAKVGTILKARNLEKLEGTHFIVRFRPQNKEMAKLVLNTAEKAYRPVVEGLGFEPKEKVQVIIYPTREALGKTFGWDADESAMGVYWAGVIRVLSPDQWVEAKNPEEFRKTFEASGPMAHEFTHLIVDYRTKGNYPRWFTEGIAQYKENQLTGFMFKEPESNLDQPLYPLSLMDDQFDYLPNQSLAYRQSLVAVQYIIEQYGPVKLDEILTNLGRGMSLNKSFQQALGVSLTQYEKDLQLWIEQNMNQLNKEIEND